MVPTSPLTADSSREIHRQHPHFERDVDKVLKDVQEGWVSEDCAASDYGVKLIRVEGALSIDTSATEDLRHSRSKTLGA